jgi:hypothetical protein
MSKLAILWARIRSSAVVLTNYVLREDGSHVLREDGSKVVRETF